MSNAQFSQSGQSAPRQSELEYGLHHVARHNAQQPEQQCYDEASAIVPGLPSYQEPEPIGLGMTFNDYGTYTDQHLHDTYHQSNDPYAYADLPLQTPPNMHTPPTPRSNTTVDGIRSTRSGRVGRRTDSPMSSDVKVSKAKAKSKPRKSAKVLPPEYRLEVSFTEMDKEWIVPLKDVARRANFTREERKAQATKKDGHVSRPMNAFLLYRSAWADRCKDHFKLSNHQYVSQILGASWAMESEETKSYWKGISTSESENHKVHLPDYRYQPSKPAGKKDRDDSEDDEYGVEDDPDGEYVPPGRQARQARKQPSKQAQQEQVQYAQDMYGYPVQMNVRDWSQEQAYPLALPYVQAQPYPQGGQYIERPHPWTAPMEDMRLMSVTPASNYSSGHGLVGLPGGMSHDMQHSRTQTPQQQYQQPQAGGSFMDRSGVLYSDRGYQQSVDPNMGLNFGQDSHFSDAIGDINAPSGLETMPQADVWLDPSLNDNPQTEYSFALAD